VLDPNRIESIAKKLRTLWDFYPTWQFHQVWELVKSGDKCLTDIQMERRLDNLIDMAGRIKNG
jgi:hypothetical protein